MDMSVRPVQPPKSRRFHEKANEVRRRKEEAERLIKERHEAVRRQHEEKIMKINEERLRQQRELKERHAKELKRQQDVLQRRMALMERDNARKKEILEKNHAVASRLATSSSRKKYAFGSSTPRELSFLECQQLKKQDKHPLREKQVPQSAVAHRQHGRSAISSMSTSMYVPSDSSRESSSVSRLSRNKKSPTKSQDLMTQSVCSPSMKLGLTPISRLRKKPLNQLTNTVPNTPPGITRGTSRSQSKTRKAKELKAKPKLVCRELAIEKQPPSSTEQPNEVVERGSSERFGDTISVEDETQPPYIAASPDEIALEIPDTYALVENEADVVLPSEDLVCQETHGMSSNPSEVELMAVTKQTVSRKDRVDSVLQTTEDDLRDIDQSKAIGSEISETNEASLSVTFAQAAVGSSLQESSSTVVDKLSDGCETPILRTSANIENSDNHRFVSSTDSKSVEEQAEEHVNKEIDENASCEDQAVVFLSNDESNVVIEQTAETQEPVVDSSYNESASVAGCGIESYSNGLAKQLTSVIPGDIPGAVPTPKEIDDSVVKKLTSPPNEFVAHRIRREQEQRELDERKARIAAILAKSRDLSSGTPVITGRTSPPRGQSAQDLLKKLASNGNLPSLQKLVSRHTSNSSGIDQMAPEDPAPQAI